MSKMDLFVSFSRVMLLCLVRKYRLFFTVSLLFKISAVSCFAAEIDSVTTRNLMLENSRKTINQIFNQRIKEGIEKANQKGSQVYTVGDLEIYQERKHCDEDDLYSELRKAIFKSGGLLWGLKGYDLDKQLRRLLVTNSYTLPLNESIYRDIDYIEGFSLNLKELSDVVNIEGNLIGIEKIGHFFAEGWRYFEIMEFEKKTVFDALAWGKEKESGLFGFTTTGIFSYADMVANFNGMRFWNKVLLKKKDPLKGVVANLLERPYVSCDIKIIESIKAGKIVKAWKYNAAFDIAEFIDGSWDEGNNCNSYADPIIEKKVVKRIHNVNPDFECPYRQKSCKEARVKYDGYSKYLLHPYCLSVK
jgi:hypothetical protein